MPKMAQTADNWETGCAMAQMRIKDIAAEAGVSPATVSRYLNNRPGQMTEETRARIAEVIERTGYRPRAAARNLRSSRTNLIGVILADIANPFSSRCSDGLDRRVFGQLKIVGMQCDNRALLLGHQVQVRLGQIARRVGIAPLNGLENPTMLSTNRLPI